MVSIASDRLGERSGPSIVAVRVIPSTVGEIVTSMLPPTSSAGTRTLCGALRGATRRAAGSRSNGADAPRCARGAPSLRPPRRRRRRARRAALRARGASCIPAVDPPQPPATAGGRALPPAAAARGHAAPISGTCALLHVLGLTLGVMYGALDRHARRARARPTRRRGVAPAGAPRRRAGAASPNSGDGGRRRATGATGATRACARRRTSRRLALVVARRAGVGPPRRLPYTRLRAAAPRRSGGARRRSAAETRRARTRGGARACRRVAPLCDKFASRAHTPIRRPAGAAACTMPVRPCHGCCRQPARLGARRQPPAHAAPSDRAFARRSSTRSGCTERDARTSSALTLPPELCRPHSV